MFHCRKIQVKDELQNQDKGFIAQISDTCQTVVQLSQRHVSQNGFGQGVTWGLHLVDNGEVVFMWQFDILDSGFSSAPSCEKIE